MFSKREMKTTVRLQKLNSCTAMFDRTSQHEAEALVMAVAPWPFHRHRPTLGHQTLRRSGRRLKPWSHLVAPLPPSHPFSQEHPASVALASCGPDCLLRLEPCAPCPHTPTGHCSPPPKLA